MHGRQKTLPMAMMMFMIFKIIIEASREVIHSFKDDENFFPDGADIQLKI